MSVSSSSLSSLVTKGPALLLLLLALASLCTPLVAASSPTSPLELLRSKSPWSQRSLPSPILSADLDSSPNALDDTSTTSDSAIFEFWYYDGCSDAGKCFAKSAYTGLTVVTVLLSLAAFGVLVYRLHRHLTEASTPGTALYQDMVTRVSGGGYPHLWIGELTFHTKELLVLIGTVTALLLSLPLFVVGVANPQSGMSFLAAAIYVVVTNFVRNEARTLLLNEERINLMLRWATILARVGSAVSALAAAYAIIVTCACFKGTTGCGADFFSRSVQAVFTAQFIAFFFVIVVMALLPYPAATLWYYSAFGARACGRMETDWTKLVKLRNPPADKPQQENGQTGQQLQLNVGPAV